jgi:hypothetical protein
MKQSSSGHPEIHNLNQIFIIDLFAHPRSISKTMTPVFQEESPMLKHDFEKLLLEAVDEGLSSLGQSSMQAIYFHLEKNFNVKKQEIPCKIEVFEDAIEKFFGLGANFLEILFMKRLHEKIEGVYVWHESSDLTFAEYVKAAKRGFLEKKRASKTAREIVQCDQMMTKC